MDQSLLDTSIRLPQNVVYREFPHETVILNLDTGKYHGVNPTGGEMLRVLQAAPSVREAAAQLAETFGRPLETIQADLLTFCSGLLERRLIEVVDDDA